MSPGIGQVGVSRVLAPGWPVPHLQLICRPSLAEGQVQICPLLLRLALRPSQVYLHLPLLTPLQLMIRDMTAKLIHLRYQPQSQRSIPSHVAINLFIAACNELMAWYLENIDECSSERAETMFDEMIMQAITHSAFVRREVWLQRLS